MDNDQRIAEIKARCNMATPGPWGTPEKPIIPLLDMPYNAGFIAHAREDMPFLLSQLAAKDAEIERLREAQRWIPVEERLPEEWQDVIFYHGTYGVKAANFRDNRFWIKDGWYMCVTRWMPLPAAPEKGE